MKTWHIITILMILAALSSWVLHLFVRPL